ncbi:MAG: hypothetical protein KDC98_23000, partial [Planctomycetes bacterium]|nr:hypothetical protein [Planctomycetota bacterium]
AFNGELVDTAMPTAAPAGETAATATAVSRSIHPWLFPAPPAEVVRLGPGAVVLDQPLDLAPGTELHIVAGTRLELRTGAGIRCFGGCRCEGTEAAPIEILRHADADGIHCSGATVTFAHTTFVDDTPWRDLEAEAEPLLRLGRAVATIEHCRFVRAAGNAIVVVGGRTSLGHTSVRRCHHTALVASDGAEVQLRDCDLLFARRAMLACDGARLAIHHGTMRGNLAGIRAERSASAFAGAEVLLDAVECAETGTLDLEADAHSRIDRRR